VPAGIAKTLEGEVAGGRGRGIDGTGGFIRIASLNAISDSGMASSLSNVVGSFGAQVQRHHPRSRSFVCHCGLAASAPDERCQRRGQRVMAAAIIRKLM